MKRVVIYYSLSGNTKAAAETIAAALSADTVAITTKRPLPKAFFLQIMTGGMYSTFGMKPAILGLPQDLSAYEEIIIGTPVWAGKHAAPIHTLLSVPGVRDKVTAVFTVSGGGENPNCLAGLKKLLPNLTHTVDLYDKKLAREAENATRIAAFVKELTAETAY